MKTIRSPAAMAAWSRSVSREGVTVGLVPTMGALHAGHRALIRAARLQCDAVVVSIFVNPTQFGPREDFSRYPRQLRRDQAFCRAEGADIVFAPETAAMYPDGFQTVVSVPAIARSWEGMVRPAHFQGVATVVAKLLCLIRPTVAFFGQKDYQQSALIQRLVTDLNMGCSIVVLPTVRESDGLALSSRNVYLSRTDRAAAPVLYRALTAGAETLHQGIRSSKEIIRVMTDIIAREPRVRIDYLAVCHPATLESLATVQNGCVLLGAVRLGSIRLIDNVVVTAGPTGSKHRGGKRTDSGGDTGRRTLGHQKT